MEWLSTIADLIGILGAIFALFAWTQARQVRASLEQERRRQERIVTVVLQSGAERLELPLELQRGELTRAELLGRLGMLPMKNPGERFSLGYLSTPEFLRQLNQVTSSSNDSLLTIPCTPEELARFAVPRRGP